MDNSPDVVVIGGGVIGICAAYYLAAQGRAVTVVEKGQIASGSSYGNAGLIVPSHSFPMPAPGVWRQGLKWLFNPESPLYIKPRFDPELIRWLWRFLLACRDEPVRRAFPVVASLAQASLKLYQEIVAGDEQEFGYEQRGGLLLCNSEESLRKGVEEARLLQPFGVEAQALDAEGVRRLEPDLRMSIVGGIHFPRDAHVTPDRFVCELARRAASQGVAIKTGVEVLGFERSDSRITTVVTTHGAFRPGEVVLASGAWSPLLGRDLGVRLPIQPAKGYSITFKRPSGSPRMPLFLTEGKVAVTPMGDRLRFAGTLELAGLDLSINQRRVQAIQHTVSRYLSDLTGLELVEIWRGLRPLTPDTLPIVGRSETLSNLIFATGHGMLGMTLGPITGKLVAELVCESAASFDLALLHARRFTRAA